MSALLEVQCTCGRQRRKSSGGGGGGHRTNEVPEREQNLQEIANVIARAARAQTDAAEAPQRLQALKTKLRLAQQEVERQTKLAAEEQKKVNERDNQLRRLQKKQAREAQPPRSADPGRDPSPSLLRRFLVEGLHHLGARNVVDAGQVEAEDLAVSDALPKVAPGDVESLSTVQAHLPGMLSQCRKQHASNSSFPAALADTLELFHSLRTVPYGSRKEQAKARTWKSHGLPEAKVVLKRCYSSLLS